MADGDTLLYEKGSTTAVRCGCGANVFKKSIARDGIIEYACNGCGQILYAEQEPKQLIIFLHNRIRQDLFPSLERLVQAMKELGQDTHGLEESMANFDKLLEDQHDPEDAV